MRSRSYDLVDRQRFAQRLLGEPLPEVLPDKPDIFS